MLTPQSIPWQDPLELAGSIDQAHWVLLHSGVQTNYSGRYSVLACDMQESIQDTRFDRFARSLSHDKPTFENAWFGYLGYGLKDTLETLRHDKPDWLELPDLYMMRFGSIFQFDHHTRSLTLWSQTPYSAPPGRKTAATLPPVHGITSNMTHAEYLHKAAQVIDHIHAGDLYQANLTRKFYGEFAAAPDHFALFTKLCAVSPAPYSAYIRIGDYHILSSSPESFLHIDADGHIATRPIKGTAPLSSDPSILANSAKDRAENLMIVDLMRNDLARGSIPGSIKTEKLFEVTTHATIHHMSSTITGQKRPDTSTLDIVKYAFPPGSMTGAPKIRAMNICSELEIQKRGIYSGAIGWFGGDGSCDLSVVIRTLVMKGNRFEFQVGGGIVADSTPQKELEELQAKAQGILRALGLTTADMH